VARQQRDREKALRQVAKLRQKASAEIERLIAFLDASDPYAATEFEEQVDDGPCDDNELDGPEHGEDEESDPPEPSLGSVGDMHFDQTRWAAGNRRDLEQDDAESGIGDADGMHEQVGTQDWQQGSMG
jgi:hypothetical protein